MFAKQFLTQFCRHLFTKLRLQIGNILNVRYESTFSPARYGLTSRTFIRKSLLYPKNCHTFYKYYLALNNRQKVIKP